jgi:hypothetical protein
MVPHVAARKTHQQLSKFSFVTPKRLLQQYQGESGSRSDISKLARMTLAV